MGSLKTNKQIQCIGNSANGVMLKLTNPHANRAWQAWLTYLSKGKPVAGCYLPNAYVKDFLVMVQNSGILFFAGGRYSFPRVSSWASPHYPSCERHEGFSWTKERRGVQLLKGEGCCGTYHQYIYTTLLNSRFTFAIRLHFSYFIHPPPPSPPHHTQSNITIIVGYFY